MKMQLKLQMKVWPLLLPPCKRLKTGKPFIRTGVTKKKKRRGEVVTRTHSKALILGRTQRALTWLQKRPFSVWKLRRRHTNSTSASHTRLCPTPQHLHRAPTFVTHMTAGTHEPLGFWIMYPLMGSVITCLLTDLQQVASFSPETNGRTQPVRFPLWRFLSDPVTRLIYKLLLPVGPDSTRATTTTATSAVFSRIVQSVIL